MANISIVSVTTATSTAGNGVVAATTPSDTLTTDLVVAIHANDFYDATAMSTPVATGSPTITAVTNGAADGGTNGAHIKSYTFSGVSGAITVTATESGPGSHDEDKRMTLWVLRGADLTTPVDSAGNGSGSSTVNQVVPACSPSTTNAFLIADIQSGGGSTTASYTPPGTITEYAEVHVGTLSAWNGYKQLAASGSTGTFTVTAGNSIPYAAISIAIRAIQGEAGVLAGTLPSLTGSLAGTVHSPGTEAGVFAGTLGSLTGSLRGLSGGTVTTGGSWYGLVEILHQGAFLAAEERMQAPIACPNDGEPLVADNHGRLRCRWDGWSWP